MEFVDRNRWLDLGFLMFGPVVVFCPDVCAMVLFSALWGGEEEGLESSLAWGGSGGAWLHVLQEVPLSLLLFEW